VNYAASIGLVRLSLDRIDEDGDAHRRGRRGRHGKRGRRHSCEVGSYLRARNSGLLTRLLLRFAF
jgi:geranylgeranyl pyrophosphate synthase